MRQHIYWSMADRKVATITIIREKSRQPTWPLLGVVGALEVVTLGQFSTEEEEEESPSCSARRQRPGFCKHHVWVI